MEFVWQIIVLFCFYLAFRKYWVYHWQTKINKAVYKFRMDIVNSWRDGSIEDYEKSKQYFDSLPEYGVMCSSFDPHNKMMFKFWIWDYKKFINNKEVFYLFYPREQTTCESHCGCH